MNAADVEKFLDCGTLLKLDSGHLLLGYGKRCFFSEPANGLSFFFPDFFLTQKNPWFTHEKVLKIDTSELKKLLTESDRPIVDDIRYPKFKSFESTFFDLQKLFDSSLLEKAVPYIYAESETRMSLKLKKHLLFYLLDFAQSNPCHTYGFWDENEGIIGATPELLFEMENDRLETVSCAGTKSLDTDSEMFFCDEKEMMEHQLVVDGIKESLEPFGRVEVGKRNIVSFSTIKHLFTPINLKLKKSAEPEEIIKSLHPTPALGAYPKKEGYKWLVDYQTKMLRKRFGAPVGFWDKNQRSGKFYVAIRCVEWDELSIKIYAGCGVVKSSVCENEWDEIQMKIGSVREVFKI